MLCHALASEVTYHPDAAGGMTSLLRHLGILVDVHERHTEDSNWEEPGPFSRAIDCKNAWLGGRRYASLLM